MLRHISNPPNPWRSSEVEWLGPPPVSELRVYEENARSILSENESPDVGFRWSVNPYRGCQHACSYCYARPYHQYIDFGAGTDFDTRIVVKTNAPELLDRALAKKSWLGEPIAFSGITDCYQPLEANYRLTRRCMEVCLRWANPAGIVTKSLLVRRDAELLAELNRIAPVKVFISIAFGLAELARLMDPGAPSPERRIETIGILADAGVPVGVAFAPVIPGLNDDQIPDVLGRARRAGARWSFITPIRLSREVLPVFTERIQALLPEARVRKILSAIRAIRGGRLNDPAFGSRMEGQGERWKVIEDLFETTCRRLGLNAETTNDITCRHPRPVQGSFF